MSFDVIWVADSCDANELEPFLSSGLLQGAICTHMFTLQVKISGMKVIGFMFLLEESLDNCG